jgi:xanthine dehydrogenase accessory factor
MSSTHTQVLSHVGPIDWINFAQRWVSNKERAVFIVVTALRGSAPRECGTWMLVSQSRIAGTLGGGELERMAGEAAQAMLSGDGQWQRTPLQCVLGPDLGQCCGGAIELLLEPIDASASPWLCLAAKALSSPVAQALGFAIDRPHLTPYLVTNEHNHTPDANIHLQSLHDPRLQLFLFGAGHVGRAVCGIATELPVCINAIDSRTEWLARLPTATNVHPQWEKTPESIINTMPMGAAALVMTFSHDLDYRLCLRLLARGDLAFIGLIGSHSKATSFRRRLKADGVTETVSEQLVSPIGRDGPPGKEPGVIALAALSEVMSLLHKPVVESAQASRVA